MDLFTFIAIIVVGAPVAKAVASRISGKSSSGGDPRLRRLLEQTEQRLEETEHRLDETAERLVDMEERLDFTERMLTRQNARDQLSP